MKSDFKTPEQIEFIDLAHDLEERFNLNRKVIARLARISPSMVSQIFSGKRNPGTPSLDWLRAEHANLVSGGKPQPKPDVIIEHDPKKMLDALKAASPSDYRAVATMIAAVHKNAIHGVSSKVADVALTSGAAALDVARRELAESQQSSGARAPSARKRARGRGVRKDSNDQPEPPEQAPK